MGGTIRFNEGDPGEVELPALVIDEAPAGLTPRLRLLSSPDFLNADVGDLAPRPGFWNPQRSPNSINDDYRRALDAVLDDWESTDPDGVLVAGDLVDGRWGRDARGHRQLRAGRHPARAAARAGPGRRHLLPAVPQAVRAARAQVFPAVGDHEYGDNPWPAAKRVLVPARSASEFADYFTRTRSGKPMFTDHPSGPHAFTAYAGRPLPDVQLITLDPFDITPRPGPDRSRPQPSGLAARRAPQGAARPGALDHRPGPPADPRAGAHPRLERRYLTGGADSQVWRLFEKYGVDLYLAGEAHDVTVLENGGVTQITHGGLFAFGLTTALLLDFYDDYIYVTLRDYDIRDRDAADGTRLWETSARACPRTSR